MNFKVELNNGRLIKLDGLFQVNAYRGLLEGEQSYGNKLVASRYMGLGKEIWPNAPRFCINTGTIDEWTKTKFPKIQCSGYFLSNDPARDRAKDGSGLNVIWFQDELCPTLNEANLALLKGIDWNRHAGDVDW